MVDVPAKKPRKGWTQEPKYKTLSQKLGIEDANIAAGFAETGSDDEAISELIASGEIAAEDLPGLLAEHGSAEAILRAMEQ